MTLTKKDLTQIDHLLDEKLKDLPTKEEFFSEIKGLPTKDELFSKMDEVMGELKTSREEQTILSHQVSDHEERLEALENINP